MTTARKRAKLAGMIARLDYRDREQFERARRNCKPDLDHDLFVASLHLPIGGGGPNVRATQYRIGEAVDSEHAGQLTLCENEKEVRRVSATTSTQSATRSATATCGQ